MKAKSFIFSILFLYTLSISQAQTVYLYTPKGTQVHAFTRDEMSSIDIENTTNSYRMAYPQATVLANASATYNCHSYAWNMKEGGRVCWLNQWRDNLYNTVKNLHYYWEDGSYIETTEAEAENFFYYNGDHSAVKSSVAGMYESKWGATPLMRHAPEYGPTNYNMQYRKYYKKNIIISTLIEGPKHFCAIGTFTTTPIPSTHTIQWTATRTRPAYGWETSNAEGMFSYTETYSTPSITLQTTASMPEFIQLSVAVKNQSGAIVSTASHTVTSGTLTPYTGTLWWSVGGEQNGSTPNRSYDAATLPYGNTLYINTSNSNSISIDAYTDLADNYHVGQFSIGGVSLNVSGIYDYYYDQNSIYITSPYSQSSSGYLEILLQNSCGISAYVFRIPIQISSSSGYSLAYPNPVSNILHVNIPRQITSGIQSGISTQSTKNKQQDIINYDIHLYDDQGNMMRRTSTKNDNIELDVSNLPNGFYYLHLYNGVSNKPLTQKIIVKH